ncbi:unnamed protein product, partial [Discosporangium mesarthrocarpum]
MMPGALRQHQNQHQHQQDPGRQETEAQKREDRSMHELYRLVSRAAQAVTLSGVLAEVIQRCPALSSSLPWGRLQGAALWRLVCGREEHSRVTSLLAALVRPDSGVPLTLREDYVRQLGQECPFYFGEGDVAAFEGLELLRRARGVMAHDAKLGLGYGGSEESDALILQGSAKLSEAASSWRPGDVLEPRGQLDRACDALLEVGKAFGVVDVCLSCAQGFTDPMSEVGGGGEGEASAATVA